MSEENNNPKPIPKNRFITGADINSYRESLIANYRDNKHKGVLAKIQENKNNITADEILADIVQEILYGGQEMLGTQLLFEEQGNLQMSTATIVKRSELLKAVADIIAKKKELNQRASDIDLNSPAFMLFQKMCFDKFMESLEQLEIDQEMISLIVEKFSKKMSNWGKELKQKLEQIAQ